MASFNKFQNFVEDLCEKVHNLTSDQLEIYLSNATPSASLDAVKADLAEITTGSGYTGPQDTQNTGAEATGTYTLTGTAITITASGGSVGPFQYIVLQNTTPTSPLDPLIGWWDYGSALTLNDGDSFTWKPNNSASTGTILTVA
jgi:hypothetical protein